MKKFDFDSVTKLPVQRGTWLGGRRPFQVEVADTPAGVDMCVWLDAAAEFIRVGTIMPRGVEPDAMTGLLLAAMMEPLDGARPARPQRVAVQDPPASLRELCGLLGIELVTTADFSPLDDVFGEAANSVGKRQLDYLAGGATGAEVKAFFAAARSFERAAPWRFATDQELVRFDGLDVSPVFAVLLGQAGLEFGVVLCLTEKSAVNVVSGRFSKQLPASVLFFSWVEADEFGPLVFEHARQHKWSLKAGEHVPFLMVSPTSKSKGVPTSADIKLTTAALQALSKVDLAASAALDEVVSLAGGVQVRVQWPVAVAVRKPRSTSSRPRKRLT